MAADQVKQIDIDYSPRQTTAHMALDDNRYTEIMYGGGKGGGKTVLLCSWNYNQAVKYINDYNIEPSKHPVQIGWMGRLRAVDFEETTLQTWFRFIPEECYTINRARREIVIGNRVMLRYGGLDDQKAINKFNGAEYGFVSLDQAEEVARNKIDVLLASRRLRINGHRCPPKALFTANPAQCWLKDEFILNPRKNQRFIQALPTDNPWLGEEYVQTLRDAFAHRPELIRAYLEGSWDAFEGDRQMIFGRDLETASQLINAGPGKRFLSCDVALGGDDECVIYQFYDTDIVAQEIIAKSTADVLANKLHRWALKHKLQAVVLDGDGNGAPVVDFLRKMSDGKYLVFGFKGASRAAMPSRFVNKRAEAWDRARLMLSRSDISLIRCRDMMGPDNWSKFCGQLLSTNYDFRAGKILAEPKEKVKTLLGCSPDRADAAIIGWYYYDMIPIPAKKRDRYGFGKTESVGCCDPMAA